MNWKQISKMTPAQLNEKLIAFGNFMKEDMPRVKKIGIFIGISVICIFIGGQAETFFKSSIKTTIEKRDGYKNIQIFLDTYQRDAKNYKDEISKLKGKLLDEASVEKSALFVQKTADSNGVTIVSSNRTSKTKKVGSGVEAQTMDLSLSGTYSSIIKMLNEMEEASFFLNIEKVAFKPNQGQSNPNEMTADIEYSVFFDTGEIKQDDKKGGAGKK